MARVDFDKEGEGEEGRTAKNSVLRPNRQSPLFLYSLGPPLSACGLVEEKVEEHGAKEEEVEPPVVVRAPEGTSQEPADKGAGWPRPP